MRRVREIRKGEIMSCRFEKAELKEEQEPLFGRPYCVAEDRIESGAIILQSGNGENCGQQSSMLAPGTELQNLRAEMSMMRAENCQLRAALDVIGRTLATVRRAQS